MATLSNYISLQTNIPNAMNAAANATTNAYNKMNTLHSKMSAVTAASTSLSFSLGGVLNSTIGNMLATGIMGAVAATQNAINNLQSTAEHWASVQARMQLVAGSQQNAVILNDMIYQSALRARGGYLEMAEAVAHLSQSAHDAFPDPREAVEFMEGIQKLFIVGGASKESQRNAMLQLTQAMASGQLQGDEFRSIAENAPMIENIIAKSMGVSRGELKKLASEGKVTADVIKNAIVDNMPEIEEQFKAMPKKWSDHMTEIESKAIKLFEPVFRRISDMANSDAIRTAVDGIVDIIQSAAPVFYWIVGVVGETINTIIWAFNSVFTFLREHSGVVRGIMIVLAGVMGFYATQSLIAAGNTLITAGALAIKTIADWAETAAIIAMIAAQEGLNAALYACPLTWIIGLVIAVIVVFFLAVEAINYFADTNISALGIIVGAFYAFGAAVANIFIFLWNTVAAFVNFFANVWHAPLQSIGNLFIDIWNGIWNFVKGRINDIIGAINKIPGINIDKVGDSTGMLQRFEIANEYKVMDTMDYMSMTDAFDNGYNVGASLGLPTMPELSKDGLKFDTSKIDESTKANKDTAKNTGKAAKEAKRTADAINMTNDEIKALRESAIDKTLQKWQDAHVINVVMNNDVDINNGTDLDGFTTQITKGIKDAFMIKREGVGV